MVFYNFLVLRMSRSILVTTFFGSFHYGLVFNWILTNSSNFKIALAILSSRLCSCKANVFSSKVVIKVFYLPLPRYAIVIVRCTRATREISPMCRTSSRCQPSWKSVLKPLGSNYPRSRWFLTREIIQKTRISSWILNAFIS